MKRILQLLPAIAAFAIVISGCKGSLSNAGPKEVLTAFFEKIAKKDLDGAAKLATKDSKTTLDMIKKGMEQESKNESMKKDDPSEEFKNMEIGAEKITGDNATVSVKNKKEDSAIEFPLVKEDGSWKVDFSMGTLMKIGMNEKNKRGGDESMENMDPEKMKESMEMADSILKNTDPEKLKEMMKDAEKAKENQ